MAIVNFSHEVPFGKTEHKSVNKDDMIPSDAGLMWMVPNGDLHFIPYSRIYKVEIKEG